MNFNYVLARTISSAFPDRHLREPDAEERPVSGLRGQERGRALRVRDRERERTLIDHSRSSLARKQIQFRRSIDCSRIHDVYVSPQGGNAAVMNQASISGSLSRWEGINRRLCSNACRGVSKPPPPSVSLALSCFPTMDDSLSPRCVLVIFHATFSGVRGTIVRERESAEIARG